MTRGPLIDAAEEDMSTGDHNDVVSLLESGYRPSPEEWAAYRLMPMGSETKAASLERRDRIGRAIRCYREMGREKMSVEQRKPIIMRDFRLGEQEFHSYVELAGDKGARAYAKRLEETDA
jgi:hypothetical protein